MPRIIPLSKLEKLKSIINIEILKWIKFVFDIINELPSNPNIGDRYIIYTDDQNNELYQYNNYIFQWNGNLWEKIPPVGGWAVYVKNKDDYYFYDTYLWKEIDNIIEHNDLNDIQGGTTNEYYHLTQNEHDTLTDGSDASNLHNHDSKYTPLNIDTSNFDSILDSTDDTVQKALDTIDDFIKYDNDLKLFKIQLKN